MRFNAFKECTTKQNAGVAIPLGVAFFYVRRWGTRESEEVLARLRRELFSPFAGGVREYFPELLAHWLAEYGVVNWKGVINDDDENELEYSENRARQLFLDKSYWLELNAKLFAECQNYENFLTDLAEEAIEEIKK